MERDDLVHDHNYSVAANHDEAHGVAIRKTIWKVTAILTIIIYLIFDISPLFFIYLVLTYLLIAVTFVDIDHFIIPNGFILFVLAVLILSLIFDI